MGCRNRHNWVAQFPALNIPQNFGPDWGYSLSQQRQRVNWKSSLFQTDPPPIQDATLLNGNESVDYKVGHAECFLQGWGSRPETAFALQ